MQTKKDHGKKGTYMIGIHALEGQVPQEHPTMLHLEGGMGVI